MNATHKSLLFLAGSTFGLAAAPLLNAQDAVTTDPVGYVTFNGDSGNYLIGSPLLKSKTFQSEISSASGSTIIFEDGIPDLSVPSYLEPVPGLEAVINE